MSVRAETVSFPPCKSGRGWSGGPRTPLLRTGWFPDCYTGHSSAVSPAAGWFSRPTDMDRHAGGREASPMYHACRCVQCDPLPWHRQWTRQQSDAASHLLGRAREPRVGLSPAGMSQTALCRAAQEEGHPGDAAPGSAPRPGGHALERPRVPAQQ